MVFRARRFQTIPNGADIDYWQPQAPSEDLRRQLGLEEQFVVLYSGAHGISQALSTILESASILKEQQNIIFLMVGEGADKEALVIQARERGLSNVRFLDPVTRQEVRSFYALANVCLVPLRNIPLFQSFIPSKMFEILAMERPIIGSVAGEAADILNRSGGAIVVAPEDSKAIAEAIHTLHQYPERGYEMGLRGRAFIKHYYSRTALAHSYRQLLHEAIASYTRK